MISVKLSELAQKQVKDLRKKYHSIASDISTLIDEIESNLKNAVDFGSNFYKNVLLFKAKEKAKVDRAEQYTFCTSLI